MQINGTTWRDANIDIVAIIVDGKVQDGNIDEYALTLRLRKGHCVVDPCEMFDNKACHM